MIQKDIDKIMAYFDQTFLGGINHEYKVSRNDIKNTLERYIEDYLLKYGRYCSHCDTVIPKGETHAFDSDDEDNPLVLLEG